MDICDFIESILCIKLFEFKKEYIRKLDSYYKENPDMKIMLPNTRGVSNFGFHILAAILLAKEKEVTDGKSENKT